MSQPIAARLFDISSEQAGVFSARQAIDLGIAQSTISRAAKRGDFDRLMRGIYALKNYPSTPDAERWAAVLYPTVDRIGAGLGVLSHDTALTYYLPDSDLAPNKIHITADFATPPRRFSIPRTISLHLGHVEGNDLAYTDGGIPITSPTRTIADCLRDGRLVYEARALEDLLATHGRLDSTHVVPGDRP